MRKSRLPRVVGMMVMFCAVMTITSSAQLLNTLLSFNGSNGQHPDSPLIQATDGNFYGVTQNGGVTNQNCTSVGCGTVFKSEEHTSELQSLTNLVCRLLLEKKKQ